MSRKLDKYRFLAANQARVNSALIRLPSGGRHLQHLSAIADQIIAGNSGKKPDNWKGLTGVLKAVADAKRSTVPDDELENNSQSAGNDADRFIDTRRQHKNAPPLDL